MPDYRAIYNDVIEREDNYNLAQCSPGYQNCVEFGHGLSLLGGRSLDFGCGVGFVLEYLAAPPFRFEVYGVDASDIAVERSRARLARFPFEPL
ncbi:MAG: class I SAM-dependent methyltransferase, partial [Planctomycetota bacterium]